MRTSFLRRAIRARGAGQLAPGDHYCVPASGVLCVPRTVAPQVGARLTWEETGLPGTLLAGFFVVYLCADTLIACLMRSHLQRSLGPLYIHHTIVVVGVVCHTSLSPTLTLTQSPSPSPSPNRA